MAKNKVQCPNGHVFYLEDAQDPVDPDIAIPVPLKSVVSRIPKGLKRLRVYKVKSDVIEIPATMIKFSRLAVADSPTNARHPANKRAKIVLPKKRNVKILLRYNSSRRVKEKIVANHNKKNKNQIVVICPKCGVTFSIYYSL